MKKQNQLIPFGVLPAIELPKAYSVDKDSIRQRDALVIQSKQLKPITSTETNDLAVATGVEIRRAIKAVEDAFKTLNRPLIDARTFLSTLKDNYIAPLLVEQNRLEQQAAVWRRQENERIERENQAAAAERKRLSDEALELQRKADEAALKAKGKAGVNKAMDAQEKANEAKETFMDAVALPEQEVVKSRGTAFKKKQCYEVTDIKAVYAANAMLVKPLEISPAAIKACLVAKDGATKEHPDTSYSGLKLWWEDDLSFRA